MIATILRDVAKDLLRAPHPDHLVAVLKACGIPFHRPPFSDRPETTGNGELTQREVEILKLIEDGHQNKEIGQKAFISLSTVKTHTRNIFDKLGVRTRVQTILKAKELGILKTIDRFFQDTEVSCKSIMLPCAAVGPQEN